MDRPASHRLRRGAARLLSQLVTIAATAAGAFPQSPPPESPAPGLVPPGHPLARAQQALLRGDESEARRALAEVEGDPKRVDELSALRPEIALLRASLVPLEARPDALLAVAAAWPDSHAADVALVAGLRAWQRIRDQRFDEVLPLLPPDRARATVPEAANAVEDERRTKMLEGEAQRLLAFQLLLEPEATSSDPALRAQARALLHELQTAQHGFTRLPVGAAPRLPFPLSERVRVRIERLPPSEGDADRSASELDVDAAEWFARPERPAPLLERTFDPAQPAVALPALEAGVYALEIESLESGWKRARTLIVSDLELIVQRRGGICSVLALIDGKPVEGVAVRAAPRAAVRTDAKGACELPVSEDTAIVVARLPASSGRAEQIAFAFADKRRSWSTPTREAAHVVVDAPFHRRGEKVRGRVAARVCVPVEFPALAGERDWRPDVRPLANTALVVRLWPHAREEKVILGSTDEDGVLLFECALASDAPYGSVPLVVEHVLPATPDQPSETLQLARESLFAVEAVKRPPLLVDVEWPEPYTGGSVRPQVAVAATFPTGAPVAGGAGSLAVSLGSFTERRAFTLDAAGRAVLPIACDTLAPELRERFRRCELDLQIVASDGETVGKSKELLFTTPATDEEEATAPRNRGLRLSTTESRKAAGDRVELALNGPPHGAVLLTAGRLQPWWRDVVVLDGSGAGRTTLPTRVEWTPEVEVVASMLAEGREEPDTAWLQIELPPAAAPVTAALLEAGARVPPHSRQTFHFVTRNGDGMPRSALVAVAVVDESLYLLAEDRTGSPSRELRPRPYEAGVDVARSLAAQSPWTIFGRLLSDGGVRSPRSGTVQPGLGGGGAATPSGNPGGPGEGIPIREDFRPIAAFFAKVRSDAQGRGEFSVDFPDDLTRWRVTLVATTPDGLGEITRANVTTERDPSLLVIPPRFLRCDDRITVPSVVHCTACGARAAELRAYASHGLELVAGGPTSARLALIDGGTWRNDWQLAANGLGSGALCIELFEGDRRLDGERREFPLLPRTVTRVSSVTGLVKGSGGAPVQLVPPRLDGALASALSVRLLGDRTALLDDASRWLAGYPYGCAEQSISRLVPLFAAARARRLDASRRSSPAAAPVLTPEEAHRFDVGMARLRDLKSADGYRWWRGGRIDLAMTPIVLTGLAMAREAGLDPIPYGAVVDFRSGLLRDCVASLAEHEGDLGAAVADPGVFAQESLAAASCRDPGQLLAELVVAVLRFAPEDASARTAVAKLVQRRPPLSPSLLARAGRALVAAGDHESARLCWSRLAGAGAAARCVVPLEDTPEALAADRLELARALELPDADVADAEAELFGLFADGRFGTTWTTATALCALAGDRRAPPATSTAQRLRVTAGGRETIVTLDAASQWRATLDLGDATAIVLEPQGECDVVAIGERRNTFDGVDGAPWSTPIGVERSLGRIVFTADGRSSREPLERGPGGAYACAVGDVLELEITLLGPLDLIYFVATCPIPAGCELVGRGDASETDGAAADDERLTWAFADLDGARGRTVRARFVVGHAGDFAWPAAQAEAMYRPGRSGASQGARLVATERPRADVSEIAAWLAPDVRRAELERRIAAVAAAKPVGERSRALWQLSACPDEEVARAARRQLLPSALRWTNKVDAFLDLLGPERAWLFAGSTWSATDAPLPEPGVLARIAWADALDRTEEGRTLVERWVRGDASLGRFERRLAALAWLRDARRGAPTFDVSLLLRTLEAEDVDAPRDAVRRERLERAVACRTIHRELAADLEAIVSHDGVRSRPDDSSAFRPLDEWRRLIQFTAAALSSRDPDREAVAFARQLLDGAPPGLDGAAPLPEETALVSEVASLRPLVVAALRRRIEHEADAERFAEERDDLEDLASVDEQALVAVMRERLAALPESGDDGDLVLLPRLLAPLEGDVPIASPLGARLARWFASEREGSRVSLLLAFPPAERTLLPESLLVRGLKDAATASEYSEALKTTAEGRALVLACLARDALESADDLGSLLTRLDATTLANLESDRLLEACVEAGEAERAIVRAELQSRARRDPRPLAAALAAPRDLRIRELLIELLAEVGCDDVPWRADDPSASRFRMLLGCRLGRPDAIDELRCWIRNGARAFDGSENVPAEEQELFARDLLPFATLHDVGEGLLVTVSDDLLRDHFRSATSDDVRAWLACREGKVPLNPARVLDVLPDAALRGAWDDLARAWQEWRERLDEGDAEWLVKEFFERTGHPCEFVRASGERRVFAPRTASEWRESLRARLRWDGVVPDFAREPAELAVAWRDELVERSFALR